MSSDEKRERITVSLPPEEQQMLARLAQLLGPDRPNVSQAVGQLTRAATDALAAIEGALEGIDPEAWRGWAARVGAVLQHEIERQRATKR